jgi:2-oxo-3-hexenedioate decarboxylase
MGLTSKAKMEQMGLHTPIAGVLTDAMEVHGGEYSLSRGVHPKAEPEIAFKIGRTIRTPLSAEDAVAHCSHVAPALEILDSRFKGFKYFSLNDVVADNCSSHAFAVGTWVPLGQAPRARTCKIELEVGGVLREQGLASDVLGDPAQSLSELTKILHTWGVELPAGAIVLTGAITAAPKLERGMFLRLCAEGLEDFTLRVD